MAKKVIVAVLGYNSSKYLPALIASLKEQAFKNVDYYYIDNGSEDNSVEIVRGHQEFTILQNKINLGYAGAYAKFLRNHFSQDIDAAILLNPDVIVDRLWLSELVSFAYSDPSVAIAQPKILQLNADSQKTDIVSSLGGDLHYLGYGILRRETAKTGNNFRETDFAIGTCMLIKRDAYVSCGGLDADFFLYMEDLDLSWRLRLCGYRCGICHDSIIWHHYIFDRREDKNRQKYYYLERNRLYSLWKNYSYKSLIILLPGLLVLEFAIIIHALLNGYFREKMLANFDFFRNIHLLQTKHHEVQKIRKVSDAYLFGTMSKRIQFDELEGVLLRAANVFFEIYYKIVRLFI